jgi:hypothetical protein
MTAINVTRGVSPNQVTSEIKKIGGKAKMVVTVDLDAMPVYGASGKTFTIANGGGNDVSPHGEFGWGINVYHSIPTAQRERFSERYMVGDPMKES